MLAAVALLPSCSFDVAQSRSVGAGTMHREQARVLARAVLEREVSGAYLIAETADGMGFGVYDRMDPARNQMELRIVPGRVGTEGVGFEVGNRGSLENARAASRVAEALTRAGSPGSMPAAGGG